MRSIFTGPVAGLALALLTAGVAQAQLTPCPGMTVMAPPELMWTGPSVFAPPPTNPASCVRGIKLEPDPGVTLWRCIVDYAPDAEPADPWFEAVQITTPDRPIQIYRDDAMMGMIDQFKVVKADLDGDGASERILALWNGVSNGMAVSGWTISVFTGDWRPIATFDVKDWGRSSIVAAPTGRKGCDLAITHWVDSVDRKGRNGISLGARFQRLSGGRMEEASDRPALQRRYTYAFQDERSAHHSDDESGEGEGDIATWLSHPSVTRVP